MDHFSDIWYWRLSDQEEVVQHLRDRIRITGEPEPTRRAGFVRSALLAMLCMAGLMKQPVEQKESRVGESCGCDGR